MSHISSTFSKETIEEMMRYYAASLVDTPQGAVFRARKNNTVITAYKSGKVLFQGKNVQTEFSKWKQDEFIISGIDSQEERSVEDNAYIPATTIFSSNHIGSDESGTGDYFGPITVCAVYVQKEQLNELKQIGIQDSKMLTDEKILQLSKKLVSMGIPYSLMIFHNVRYNELQQAGWSQGKMKAMLHHAAIEKVIERISSSPYEGIIIDQFCAPELYRQYLQSEGLNVFERTYFMTKAEDYSLAVAAASIIARASFVQEMRRLSELVGIKLPFGASHEVDNVAATIIQKKGKKFLSTIAKVHFANTEKAERYLKKS